MYIIQKEGARYRGSWTPKRSLVVAQKWLNPKNVPTNTKNIYDQFLRFILLIQYIPLILRHNHFKLKQKKRTKMNSSDHQRRPLHLIPCFGSKYKFTNGWNIENHGLMQKKKIRSTNRIVTSWANHKNLQPSRKLTQVPNFDGIDHEKWGLSIVKLVYRRNVQVNNLFLTKKICSPFFSCTQALSYALLWLLQNGVYVFPSKSNWKKKLQVKFPNKKGKRWEAFFWLQKQNGP